MKKEYKTPTMEVVNLKMESCLMAGSPGKGGEYGGGGILGREYDDDWDEE